MRHPLLFVLAASVLLAMAPLAVGAYPDASSGGPPEDVVAGVSPDTVPAGQPGPAVLTYDPAPPAPVDLTEPASATPTDPVPVPGTAPTRNPDIDELVAGVGDVIHAYRTGGWLAVLAVFVALLTAMLRRPLFGRLLDHLPKRLRILVPLLLGCAGAGLASSAGGLPWLEAVTLAVLTGPTAVALHQGIARALLGLKSPASQQWRHAPVTPAGR